MVNKTFLAHPYIKPLAKFRDVAELTLLAFLLRILGLKGFKGCEDVCLTSNSPSSSGNVICTGDRSRVRYNQSSHVVARIERTLPDSNL
ncbi:hypothetical protein RRG08_023182 [Elysia crispata]|uniref:Uncharacterized protein n=1 Tax=Elysia crispata TaxID=231223 RepID=A0AAE1DKM7_9GAST|nr:hypothetical protein RRG08_023182 [Elysia crispata]